MLRVWPSRGAQRSAESASFLKVEPRKKQVTLYDLAAGPPGSAGPRRTATAVVPKMFAFDAVFPQDSEQVRGRGRQPGAPGSAPCQGAGGRPPGPAAWAAAALSLPRHLRPQAGGLREDPTSAGAPRPAAGLAPGLGGSGSTPCTSRVWRCPRRQCDWSAHARACVVQAAGRAHARACLPAVRLADSHRVPCVPVSCEHGDSSTPWSCACQAQ